MNAILMFLALASAFGAGFLIRHALIAKPPLPPRLFELPDHAIARIVHEAYRAYCVSVGDLSHKGWVNLGTDARREVINAVRRLRAWPHLAALEADHLKTHLIHAIVGLFTVQRNG